MLKNIVILLVLFVGGCDMYNNNPPIEVQLERERERCRQMVDYDDFWGFFSRRGCLQKLNYRYLFDKEHLISCKDTLARYKTSWEILDWKIIAKAKANNEPLPENFKTTEDIFATYPNPCQNDDAFWQQVKEYEVQQKTKKT